MRILNSALSILGLLFLTVSAHAMTPMGTPVAADDEVNWRVKLEWNYVSLKAAPPPAAYAFDKDISKVEMTGWTYGKMSQKDWDDVKVREKKINEVAKGIRDGLLAALPLVAGAAANICKDGTGTPPCFGVKMTPHYEKVDGLIGAACPPPGTGTAVATSTNVSTELSTASIGGSEGSMRGSPVPSSPSSESSETCESGNGELLSLPSQM